MVSNPGPLAIESDALGYKAGTIGLGTIFTRSAYPLSLKTILAGVMLP